MCGRRPRSRLSTASARTRTSFATAQSLLTAAIRARSLAADSRQAGCERSRRPWSEMRRCGGASVRRRWAVHSSGRFSGWPGSRRILWGGVQVTACRGGGRTRSMGGVWAWSGQGFQGRGSGLAGIWRRRLSCGCSLASGRSRGSPAVTRSLSGDCDSERLRAPSCQRLGSCLDRAHAPPSVRRAAWRFCWSSIPIV
jgi:hypothetical protein